MAFKTKMIQLTDSWQLLIDNSGTNANENNSFYVNSGSAIFVFSDTEPTEDFGMRISAGARIINVPVGAKLWGKLNETPDNCIVMINIDE